MGKFIRKVAIILAPILIYFAIFVAFEPNNYFGIKPKADGTDIIAALREYQANPQDRIILGDSRMAKFDPKLVEEITGHSYANLAYGGATITEQLDILNWALEQNPNLSEVVFMVSFYTFNESYNHNRRVISVLNNPLAYVTNLGYNINMLTNMMDHIVPGTEVGGDTETKNPADYKYEEYILPTISQPVTMRTEIGEHITNMLGRSSTWQLNEEVFERLIDSIRTCKKNSVRMFIVLPPAAPDVYRYMVEPLGIEQPMQEAISELLASGADVCDYEFSELDLLQDEDFYDGFHLDLERGLPKWTRMLFEEIH